MKYRVLFLTFLLAIVGVLGVSAAVRAFNEPPLPFPDEVPMGVLKLEGIDVSQKVQSISDASGHLNRDGVFYLHPGTSDAAGDDVVTFAFQTTFNIRDVDAGPRLTIIDNGNVGIGMTNPSNKLHVEGNIGATGWIGAGCEVNCESSGGSAILHPAGYLFLNNSALASAQTSYGTMALMNHRGSYYGLLFGPGTGNPNIMFDTSGNGGIYYENWDWLLYTTVSNHNIGIGMTSPSHKLDVKGGVRADYLRVNGEGKGAYVTFYSTTGRSCEDVCVAEAAYCLLGVQVNDAGYRTCGDNLNNSKGRLCLCYK